MPWAYHKCRLEKGNRNFLTIIKILITKMSGLQINLGKKSFGSLLHCHKPPKESP